MRIVLTGTPGTGKTSMATQLAKLAGGPLIDLNAFARKNKLFLKEKGAFGESVVNVEKMEKLLAAALRNEKNFVVEGHLACEFSVPADAIVVLRCDPRVLKKRLEERKYPVDKIRENVLAELLDYCLIKSEQNYGRGAVLQLDATRGLSAKQVFAKAKAKKGDRVDWSKQLLEPKQIEFLLAEAESARSKPRRRLAEGSKPLKTQ